MEVLSLHDDIHSFSNTQTDYEMKQVRHSYYDNDLVTMIIIAIV